MPGNNVEIFKKYRAGSEGMIQSLATSIPFIDSGISYLIAQEVAKKHGIEVTHHDFGRGEDETEWGYVFASTINQGNEKISEKKLRTALKEYESRLKKLVQLSKI